MGNLLNTIVAQFKSFYGSLPPLKRNAIIASTIIVVVGLAVVYAMITKTDYVPLFTNVDAEQMPQVIERLRTKNIPFRIGDMGNAIYVPRELLPATQMAIMSELGSNKVGTLGLEIFEKQEIGISSYAQKINYQRAIQGELMRSINTLSAIKQSKVLLALPNKKTFLEEGGQTTASVVLELHPGKTLSQDQVRGITHLVASAVENLDPEKVTVVDEKGKVLSKNYNSESGLSAELLDIKKQHEREAEERIESILARVVGADKVIARVSSTLNQKSVNSVEEIVDPDSTAIRSQVTEEEMLDGSRTNPTGVPGARANLPGANDQGQVGFQQNVRKEMKTTNFSVPKTVRKVQEAAGDILRMSVAVLVDGTYEKIKDKDGNITEKWVQRTPEELAKYEEIVKNAIGFDAKRQDSIKVENIKFEKEDFVEADQILENLERRKIKFAIYKWTMLGGVLALFFFIVVRPFMRWVTDSFQDTVEDMLPRTIEELEELQSADNTLPGMSGALPVLEESIDPNKAESELLKERIMNVIEQDIEKSAAAFNMWVSRRDN
ncbi:MAG: flagellar M-ring protein FliF [Bdellovibrionales bacterium RBG_16_40_8]|nr:MAG: flagellar M-ring protein FliF [Bdellovibrionales bacterium RBG_16_40_8]